MKYLIPAAIIGLLLALLLRRLLPYLRMAQNFIKAIQQLRAGAVRAGAPITPRAQAQERLVRCSVCGTWVPSARAVINGSSAQLFCSESCSRQADVKGRRRAAS